MQLSTIRFLVSGSCTISSEFDRFVSSGISDEEVSIVLEHDLLKFTLGLLVFVLLVVSDDTFRDGLSDSVDLIRSTTTLYADAHVDILELVATDDKHGLKDLHA